MKWSRVFQYAVIGAMCGAVIAAGIAMYTDESWLSPDVQSFLIQGRARRKSVVSERLDSENGVAQSDTSPLGGRSVAEPTT